MKRDSEGLMHLGTREHNRLQILITKWMLDNVPESTRLPHTGNGALNEVACRATTAACESVASSLEILGLAEKG
jgi:hypothetical protein